MTNNKKSRVAGYGLYYRANNQLIRNTSDRVLFQCLIDLVRRQLKDSPYDQTVFISKNKLARFAGVNVYHTLPASLERLEKLGLVQNHNNAVTIKCDEYVSVIKYYEALDDSERTAFADSFNKEGLGILQSCNIVVEKLCRNELLDMVGTSISLPNQENHCKTAINQDNETENIAELQQNCKTAITLQFCNLPAKLQQKLQLFAKTLQNCNTSCTFAMLCEDLPDENLQDDSLSSIENAFSTGSFQETAKITDKFYCNIAMVSIAILQFLGQKPLQFCNTDINNKYKEKMNERSSQKKVEKSSLSSEKGEEDFPLKPLSHVEDETSSSSPVMSIFKKAEVLTSELSETDKDDCEDDELPVENIEEESDVETSDENKDKVDIIQLEDKERFGKDYRKTREYANPYKDKPYLSERKISSIFDKLDNCLTSSYKLFLYNFLGGLYEFYLDERAVDEETDEYGDVIPSSDNEEKNIRHIDGILIEKYDLQTLIKQAYNQTADAIEAGIIDDKKLSISELPDWKLSNLFDWNTRKGELDAVYFSVNLHKIRDIETTVEVKKAPVSKEERKLERKMSAAMIGEIFDSEPDTLTPIELVIQKFLAKFAVWDEGYIGVKEFESSKEFVIPAYDGKPAEKINNSVRTKELTRIIYQKELMNFTQEAGVEYPQFFEVLNDDCKLFDEQIKAARDMFSYIKVDNMNKLQGWKSTITKERLENSPYFNPFQ